MQRFTLAKAHDGVGPAIDEQVTRAAAVYDLQAGVRAFYLLDRAGDGPGFG